MKAKKYDKKKIMLIITTVFLWGYYAATGYKRLEFWKMLIFWCIMMFGIITTDLEEVKKGVSKNMPKNLK